MSRTNANSGVSGNSIRRMTAASVSTQVCFFLFQFVFVWGKWLAVCCSKQSYKGWVILLLGYSRAIVRVVPVSCFWKRSDAGRCGCGSMVSTRSEMNYARASTTAAGVRSTTTVFPVALLLSFYFLSFDFSLFLFCSHLPIPSGFFFHIPDARIHTDSCTTRTLEPLCEKF